MVLSLFLWHFENQKIEKLTVENSNISEQIDRETIIKDLIFETGKQLEKAVIKAVRGFSIR